MELLSQTTWIDFLFLFNLPEPLHIISSNSEFSLQTVHHLPLKAIPAPPTLQKKSTPNILPNSCCALQIPIKQICLFSFIQTSIPSWFLTRMEVLISLFITSFLISGVKRISGSYFSCPLNSPLLLHTHSAQISLFERYFPDFQWVLGCLLCPLSWRAQTPSLFCCFSLFQYQDLQRGLSSLHHWLQWGVSTCHLQHAFCKVSRSPCHHHAQNI